ncbi:MAG: threonine--tRNA ligase [Patescibacteria group bacterium]
MSNEKLDSSNEALAQLEMMRHSLSHIMAQAVLKIYPQAQLTIGPAVANGFYYDFDLGENSFSPENLKQIQKEMERIVREDQKFEQYLLPISEAKEKLKNNPYKLELIVDLEKEGETQISFYKNLNKNGEVVFEDMCRGPHLNSTKEVGSFKVQKVAGAYWRGDEHNKMLQRLYALAFATEQELADYQNMLVEAEKRDHRKIGKELGLFIFSELVGPGLPLYTAKGAKLRRMIADYSRTLREAIGYEEVHTPNMNKAELFKVSGHYDKYKDDMFEVHSHYTDEEYYLKPMNCPQHTQIFASVGRSYRDLPVRIADFANLYRDEKPGELSGLTRLRCFCQDDGHCFCREDQIKSEFNNVLGAIKKAMIKYGLNYHIRLSLRDENKKEKYLGDNDVWEKSQNLLREILVEQQIEFVATQGEAAFYGPKMDLIVKDSLGREWQISTIQLDFNMPKRFSLEYTDENGEKKQPIMIHSAIVGSPERFMGILIEHYAGAFPLWLSPEQIRVLPVSEKFIDYAEKVKVELKEKGWRVTVDNNSESLPKRIRTAEKEKLPYILVIGEKEVEAQTVAVRRRGEGDLGVKPLSEFLEILRIEN